MRPQAGDVLAFKILSLNEETWTPELSAYQEATVSLECRGWQYLPASVVSFVLEGGGDKGLIT